MSSKEKGESPAEITKLALNDIVELRADIRHLKACQFQLLLASLPIIIALFSAVFSISEGLNSISAWIIPLPIICALISFMLYIVFLQKTVSIRYSQAFCLLLQEYISQNKFPSNYRGWADAVENYNNLKIYGELEAGKYQPNIEQKKYLIPKIRPNSFTWLATMILPVIPLISMPITWYLSIKNDVGNTSYTIILFLSTLLLVVGYSWLFRHKNKMSSGSLSFSYLYEQFRLIVEKASSFKSSGEKLA